MTDNGYMSFAAWEELTPNMAKGIRKPPIIWYSPAHWWVLKIVDGFGTQNYSLKPMEIHEKYKVLMLKEEGDNWHVCQIYDQDAAKQYNTIFSNDLHILRSWIPKTRVILDFWCLVNVGLQDVKKLPRESWIYYFKKSNLHPKHRVSFSQWCDLIKPFIQGADYFKQDTTLTIND